jgi:hypothetical protein
MGDVIPIARRTCPCGWEYPPQLLLVVAEPVRQSYSVRFTCPKCGEWADTVTVPAEKEEA